MFMNQFYKLGLRTLYYFNNEYVYKILRWFMVPQITQILIHVNNKCNYHCKYCYVDKTTLSLEWNDWISVLEQAKKLGVKKISLLGGEPFCEPHLEDILAKITALGMKPYIYTNGSFVTKEWIARLLLYKPLVIFKYDVDTETYQYHTQQDTVTLDDIEEKIRLSRKNGLQVMTFSTLLKKNVKRIEEIFDQSLSLGALPAFERYLPVKDAPLNKELEITDEEYEEAMGKISIRFAHVKKEWTAAMRIAGRSCGCYSDILSISPTGEVLPCPYLPDEVSLGNVKERTLRQIYTVLQNKKRTEYKLDDECKSCSYKYENGGGCYTYSYLKDRVFKRHYTKNASLGLCAYLLVDMYEQSDSIKL